MGLLLGKPTHHFREPPPFLGDSFLLYKPLEISGIPVHLKRSPSWWFFMLQVSIFSGGTGELVVGWNPGIPKKWQETKTSWLSWLLFYWRDDAMTCLHFQELIEQWREKGPLVGSLGDWLGMTVPTKSDYRDYFIISWNKDPVINQPV